MAYFDTTNNPSTNPATDFKLTTALNRGSSTLPDLTGAAASTSSAASQTLGQSLDPSLSTLGVLGAGAVGMYMNNQAQKQNTAEASQLKKLAQPQLGAANSYLSAALTGELTPAQKAAQDAMFAQGNTLTAEASPWLSAASQGLQQAESGQLPAWQQQQLDNQTAAQIAQLKASLGSGVDSSSLAAGIAQIQGNADIVRGQLVQQNLDTAKSQYATGIATQEQGYAALDAGYQAAITDAQNNFADAMTAFAQGDQVMESAIQLEIQGNTAIAGATQQLFGNLAMAYALLSKGGGGGGEGVFSKIGDKIGNMFSSSPADTGSSANYNDIADTSVTTPTVDYFGGDAGATYNV